MCGAQARLGYKYGERPDSTFIGATIRSISWSLVTCWSVIGGSGHGLVVIPMPSLLAAGVSIILGTDESGTIFFPSPYVIPLIPIILFVFFYFIPNRENL